MKKLLLLVLPAMMLANSLAAQDSSLATLKMADTLNHNFVQKLQKLGKQQAEKSIKTYSVGRIAIRQRNDIDNLKRLNERLKILLKGGVDTLTVNNLLLKTKESIAIVQDGIVINRGANLNQRNLEACLAILSELAKKIERQKKDLDEYSNSLIDFRVKIDSLRSDTALYTFPSDSTDAIKYVKRLTVIVKDITPVDKELDRAITIMEELQLQVDLVDYEIRSFLKDIRVYRADLASKALYQEFPYLWSPRFFPIPRPINEAIRLSWIKISIILRYYLEEHELGLIILAIVLGCVFKFIRSLKQQLISEDRLNEGSAGQIVVQYPFLSATMITLCTLQFLFPQPPFIFNFFLWQTSALCLLFIFGKFISAYWRRFCIIAVIFFALAGIDNMILEVSRPERVYAAILSLAGMVFTAYIFFNKRRGELKEKSIIYFTVFVFVFQLFALLLNMYGRYNMSKTFFISGYAGGVIAMLFLGTARLINDGLMAASGVYKKRPTTILFINFDRTGTEVPPSFYRVMIIGWLFLVSRNFYILYGLFDSFIASLEEEKTVGDYKFSIMNILIFFLVIFCSFFLSKLFSLFASEQISSEKDSGKKKFRFASYILLIRIFIICAGIFVAFAAAGISLDKVTIIFGALGVGIGLGLQGLVNNLVSGLIISFERPVKVGDIIEVNGKFATMKSIGFRSSIVTRFDGSCVVIPNGELLNQQMVNWTMGENRRRDELLIGVAYGTDLEKARSIILNVLSEDERILRNPAPDVSFKEFGQSSININVLYWPKNISISFGVKSDIILKIDTLFKKEGISIPFPQQDLHIRTIPEAKKIASADPEHKKNTPANPEDKKTASAKPEHKKDVQK